MRCPTHGEPYASSLPSLWSEGRAGEEPGRAELLLSMPNSLLRAARPALAALDLGRPDNLDRQLANHLAHGDVSDLTADDLGAFHLPLRVLYAEQLARGEPFDWMPQRYSAFPLMIFHVIGALNALGISTSANT